MFEFIKKNINILAPIDGKVVDLSDVDDMVFSQKLAGDGIAIESTGDTVLSPVSGKISFMFKTKHAFIVTGSNGVQVLVHIGTDTLNLHGEGFTSIKKQGDSVKAGDRILKLDRNYIEGQGCALIVPVLITRPEEVEFLQRDIGQTVKAGEEIVMKYKVVKKKEF